MSASREVGGHNAVSYEGVGLEVSYMKISRSDSFTQVARPHMNKPLHINYRVR